MHLILNCKTRQGLCCLRKNPYPNAVYTSDFIFFFFFFSSSFSALNMGGGENLVYINAFLASFSSQSVPSLEGIKPKPLSSLYLAP